MADQKITELPIKNVSAIQLADYLLGIDSAEGYQMLISDLAKKIIEAYSGSSLGGAAQTLKSALDTVTTNAGNNLATIEASTTASKAYAVGDYLVLNGILYKVTTAIASGGTITVGTNVTVAAAGDDIAAIAAKIGNTSMGTTATTITGAIAEHEADISGLNSKTVVSADSYIIDGITFTFRKYGRVVIVTSSGIPTSPIPTNASAGNVTIADKYRPVAAAICHVMATNSIAFQMNIGTSGMFQIGYAEEALSGANVRVCMTYISAS